MNKIVYTIKKLNALSSLLAFIFSKRSYVYKQHTFFFIQKNLSGQGLRTKKVTNYNNTCSHNLKLTKVLSLQGSNFMRAKPNNITLCCIRTST